MARIRSNNVFGTTTNDPLTNVASTLNAAGLANLAAVAAPDVAVVTLDPNRVNGAPEIVYVTAHTGSATSATILRGQEGTAARAHPAGTFWVHAPTALDAETVWNPPACRVFNSAAVSIPNNSQTAIPFDSERYDTDAMHSTGSLTSRITIQTPGLYVVVAGLGWAPAAGGRRIAYLIMDGVSTIALDERPPGATGDALHSISTVAKLAAGQYVELAGYQTSGAALNASVIGLATPDLSATWIGSGD